MPVLLSSRTPSREKQLPEIALHLWVWRPNHLIRRLLAFWKTTRLSHAAAVLIVTSCLASCAGNGPIFQVQSEFYDWVSDPDSLDPRSDRQPVLADPVATFALSPGERRSSLVFEPEQGLGFKHLYGFDIRASEDALPETPVAISRIVRESDPSANIISIELDAKRGVSVFGRSCLAPDELDDWHRVEFRMRFSDNDSGYLEVFCDRQPVWAATDIRTTFPPTCRRSEGCTAAVPRPFRIVWEVGLISDADVSQNVEIDMQRLHHRFLFLVQNRIRTR